MEGDQETVVSERQVKCIKEVGDQLVQIGQGKIRTEIGQGKIRTETGRNLAMWSHCSRWQEQCSCSSGSTNQIGLGLGETGEQQVQATLVSLQRGEKK